MCLFIRCKDTNISSIHLFKISNFPLDWAFSEELVPKQHNISFQKLLLKIGSLSIPIILGIWFSLWNYFMNLVSTVLSLKRWEREKKLTYFVSLSTTTMMAVFNSYFGGPVIKNIDASSQCWLGMGNGCRILSVFIVYPLLFWRTKHSTKKIWTSVLIPSLPMSSFIQW